MLYLLFLGFITVVDLILSVYRVVVSRHGCRFVNSIHQLNISNYHKP